MIFMNILKKVLSEMVFFCFFFTVGYDSTQDVKM